jgi:broad specificity phosphatase PhoE
MARVILVRHCESEANRAGSEGGGSNSPLSARGRTQAAAVHRAFLAQDLGQAVLISSPLTRAADTAAAISEALGLDLNDPASLGIVGGEVLEAFRERIDSGVMTLVAVSHRYPIWAVLTRLYGDRGTEIMDELNNLGNGDSLELRLEGGAADGEPVHRPLPR